MVIVYLKKKGIKKEKKRKKKNPLRKRMVDYSAINIKKMILQQTQKGSTGQSLLQKKTTYKMPVIFFTKIVSSSKTSCVSRTFMSCL